MVEQIKAGDWAAAANTLAAKLNEMVDTVDWAGVGDKIGYYLNGALTFLATFIQNFDWKNLASRFAELLNHIITGVDWGNLGVILTGKWAIILKSLDGFFGTLDGAAVSKAITDFMYGTVNAADWIGIAGSLAKTSAISFRTLIFRHLPKRSVRKSERRFKVWSLLSRTSTGQCSEEKSLIFSTELIGAGFSLT